MNRADDKRDAIVDLFRENERERLGPPTVRELGAAVGLSSTSTVFAHLRQLVRQGRLERIAHPKRDVRYIFVLAEGEPCPVCGVQPALEQS